MKNALKKTISTIVTLAMLLLMFGSVMASAADIYPDRKSYLSAGGAILDGRADSIRISDSGRNEKISHWYDNTSASWDLNVLKDGKYKVRIWYVGNAHPNTNALILDVDGRDALKTDIPMTGEWGNWEDRNSPGWWREVGEIELKTSDKKLTILNTNTAELWNLRAIMIIPVNEAPLKVAGTTSLYAIDAVCVGANIGYESFSNAAGPNLGWWDPGNSAYWNIDVTTPGTYKVFVTYTRDNATTPRSVIVNAGGQSVSKEVTGTGSWDDKFVDLEVGTIKLSASDNKIEVTHSEGMEGALFNMTQLKLELVSADASATGTTETSSTSSTSNSNTPSSTATSGGSSGKDASPGTSDNALAGLAFATLIISAVGIAVLRKKR